MVTLLDPSNVYWTDDELLDYCNAGCASVAAIEPSASSTTSTISLVAGINQSLPPGGTQFFDALINTASGNSILTRDLKKFNTANPSWAAAAQAVDVSYVFPDNRNPTYFAVSPPNNGSGSILAIFGIVPAVLTSPSQEIPISDVYQDCIWAFIMFHALSKNTDRQDLAKADQFLKTGISLTSAKQKRQADYTSITALPNLSG